MLGLFGACSSPLERPPLTTDCTQGDDYEFEAITPSFWFGFGDETPGAYDGAADGVQENVKTSSPTDCIQHDPIVEPRATPPDPSGLAHWSERIAVRGDLELAVALVASAEYGRRAVARFASE